MEPITVKLRYASEKKHSHRYDKAEEDGAVTGVYVSKSALPALPPRHLVLTLSEEDNQGN